jgi:thiol-disulfide isomerase/thioredoxin
MKKIISSAILMMFIRTHCLSQGIIFQNLSYSEALLLSSSEKKMIFIDAYASWCNPCKMLEKKVFSDEKVADYFNKNFICLRYDIEKGEGVNMAIKLNVEAMPSLYFIDSHDNVIKKSVGYKDANKLLQLAAIAINPENAPSEILKKKLNADNSSISLVFKYIKALIAEDKNYLPTLETFVQKINANIFLENDTAFSLFIMAHGTMNLGKMSCFVDNARKFRAQYGDEAVNQFVVKIIKK